MTPQPEVQLPFSPSAERNKDPILAVLRQLLPASGKVLEIASGTGQHAVHFAAALPDIQWQPTEADPQHLSGIEARRRASSLANVAPARALDVHALPWQADPVDAVFCANMVHIAPWSATPALMAGAAQVVGAGGLLVLYGPYRRDGLHTSDGNLRFDAELRARDPSWGIRDTRDVVAAAADAGFALREIFEMPANNLTLVFERGAA